MMLKLTPEMVEDWDKDGDYEKMDKMEMDGEKKPMESLLIKPANFHF